MNLLFQCVFGNGGELEGEWIWRNEWHSGAKMLENGFSWSMIRCMCQMEMVFDWITFWYGINDTLTQKYKFMYTHSEHRNDFDFTWPICSQPYDTWWKLWMLCYDFCFCPVPLLMSEEGREQRKNGGKKPRARQRLKMPDISEVRFSASLTWVQNTELTKDHGISVCMWACEFQETSFEANSIPFSWTWILIESHPYSSESEHRLYKSHLRFYASAVRHLRS